jgi:hypothetical protein
MSKDWFEVLKITCSKPGSTQTRSIMVVDRQFRWPQVMQESLKKAIPEIDFKVEEDANCGLIDLRNAKTTIEGSQAILSEVTQILQNEGFLPDPHLMTLLDRRRNLEAVLQSLNALHPWSSRSLLDLMMGLEVLPERLFEADLWEEGRKMRTLIARIRSLEISTGDLEQELNAAVQRIYAKSYSLGLEAGLHNDMLNGWKPQRNDGDVPQKEKP